MVESKKSPWDSKKIDRELHPNGGKCAYRCECKQCIRCHECDYVVNETRKFYHQDKGVICENCLKIKKECFACGDNFTCSRKEYYDYCPRCELNGSRYIPKGNRCPECGDGSGVIKFPHQPPRSCKICSLTKPILQHEARTKQNS